MRNNTAGRFLIKILSFWLLFVVLHFGYDWFQHPLVAVVSGTNESFLQHAKIGFIAYSLVSAVEYGVYGRRQVNARGFLNARVLTSLMLPGLMFVLWYLAPAFYGKPMPNDAAEIFYASLILLGMAAILIAYERDLEKLILTVWKERMLWVLWLLALLEMVLFTFNLPWADFFRG
jgi:hypothetical protein